MKFIGRTLNTVQKGLFFSGLIGFLCLSFIIHYYGLPWWVTSLLTFTYLCNLWFYAFQDQLEGGVNKK